MANLKAGILGAVGTVVVVMVEYLLFPIALTFQSNLNSSSFVTASDRAILANAPTLMIVVILFTLLGGMIGSIFLAVKGN